MLTLVQTKTCPHVSANCISFDGATNLHAKELRLSCVVLRIPS